MKSNDGEKKRRDKVKPPPTIVKSGKLKIIFVYNADSGYFNLLTDAAHKILSPQTYACRLCAVTHSNFGMKKEWKKFLKTLDFQMEFLHADEFKSKYQSEKAVLLPAIFRLENDALNLMLEVEAINECRSIEDLKRKILFALEN